MSHCFVKDLFYFSRLFGPTNISVLSQLGRFMALFKAIWKQWLSMFCPKLPPNERQRDPNDTPETPRWNRKGDKLSPMTPQRRANGPPTATNGAPMAVQRHPRQPKGLQRPPKTGRKSPMKPKTWKNAIVASFRMQYYTERRSKPKIQEFAIVAPSRLQHYGSATNFDVPSAGTPAQMPTQWKIAIVALILMYQAAFQI